MAMNGLFQSSGLEQDSGLLKERWQQEGSNQTSFEGWIDKDSDNKTIYTVTAGKKFYCTQIVIQVSGQFNSPIYLKDDSTTIKTFLETLYPIGIYTFNYGVPLVFDTDVRLHETTGTSGYWNVTFVGWEE